MLQRKMTGLCAVEIGKLRDEHEDEVKMNNGGVGGEIEGKKDGHTEIENISDFVEELVGGVKGEMEGFLLETKLDNLTTNNRITIRYESC